MRKSKKRQRRKADSLTTLRKQILSEIESHYPSVENFCLVNDISKSILSRLLSGRQKSFSTLTLERIAKALEKSIEIRLK